MIKFSILIFQLLVLGLYGQTNLVLNGSLEDWHNDELVNWKIEAKSVDLYTGDVRISDDIRVQDKGFRSRFPSKGSQGSHYFGVAGPEAISCRLSDKLTTGNLYRISFYVRNPPVYNDYSTNTFTVKGYDTKGKERIIVLESKDVIDTTMHHWIKISKIFDGFDSTTKFYFGYFGDSFNDLEFKAYGLYYLFDEVEVVKGVERSDTIVFNFEKGESSLSQAQQSQLKNSANNPDKMINNIVINGYASQVGDDSLNMELSRKRTLHIRDIVSSWTEKINVNHYGETKSKEGNETEDRKVEVIITFTSF